MKPSEAVGLCHYVAAACPQQAMDDYTPQTWADLLEDVRIEDATAAARILARRQPFVAPAEIITEVKRLRADRVSHADYPIPLAGLTQPEEREWIRQAYTAIADGNPEPDNMRVLTQHAMPALRGLVGSRSDLQGENVQTPARVSTRAADRHTEAEAS